MYYLKYPHFSPLYCLHSGIYYSIAYACAYLYFTIRRYLEKRRLSLYDPNSKDDPEKLAFFVPKLEWNLETPQKYFFLLKNADDVSCFGVNSKEQFLSVYLSRKPGSKVHQSLQLQLGNGRRYWLPEEHICQKETEEGNTFGSARLKMECLLPMRRWRIFYNGLLWEKNGGDPELKHVKFAFLWVASSDIFDQTTDFSTPLMAHVAASQKHSKHPISFAKNLLSMCSGYHHPGMFYGTVEVEGHEAEEVLLWGDKSRFMGEMSQYKDGLSYGELNLNAENGTYIHIKSFTLPNVVSHFRYGFLMKPNGKLCPLDECQITPINENVHELLCQSGGGTYKMGLKLEEEGQKFSNHLNGETNIKFCRAQINGMVCHGITRIGAIGEQKKQIFHDTSSSKTGGQSLTLSILDTGCQNSNLTGGKGSSLAKLNAISENGQVDKKFHVPRGIVVTTAAYEKFISGTLDITLNYFQKMVWTSSSDDYSDMCKKIAEEITNATLPDVVVKCIEKELINLFGVGYSEVKFAVRSSATGEDTEQMSAAGQMDTFLGVKGLEEILNSLKKCWASQFGYIAVQYKRRYGQLINSPMAVVIQEMVPCEVAGVLFTCDPVSGNPTYISISANYGLGESVVSASSDPDTITLKRNLKNELVIHSKQVGSKKSKVVMTDSVGVENIDLGEDESSNCCLNDEMAINLGKVAIEIEEQYGNPRDMEWGIIGDQIYLLQARPITSINVETDFEIKHAMDSFIRREDEYTTKANIGEVFCGATSPLGMDMMGKLAQVTYPRYRHLKGLLAEVIDAPPYYPNGIMIIYGHAVFTMSDAFFRFSETEGGMSEYTKAMSVALLGRVMEDQRLFKIAQDRHPGGKTKFSIFTNVVLLLMMFFAGYRNRYLKKKLVKFQIPIKKERAADIFKTIARHYSDFDMAMVSHMECTFSSSFWNLNTLSLLAKEEGDWDNNVYGDFAYLMSTCSQVESADVPTTLQRLGYTISKCIKPDEFKKMSVEEAIKWLSTTESEAGIQFRNFLKKHGHRGIKEFDINAMTWGLDQKPLVKMLQGIVSENLKDATEKEIPSTTTIISKLQIHLDFFSRLRLRFILPNCQRCVREREYSKSVLIKQFDKIRGAYNKLGDAMVREGRIPKKEYIFFMNVEEIRILLKTRSPRIVSSAHRRWKVYPELDKLIFPEICIGLPKPINMEEDIRDVKSDLVMTGVPVSQGVVTARACVIVNVEDATTIQQGDILITYATDIGWSPYFPLLSGVVTELGGLVSHGAVVAREYGLPCVVNLHGATRLFKTGDIVKLDGNKGILKRLEPKDSFNEQNEN